MWCKSHSTDGILLDLLHVKRNCNGYAWGAAFGRKMIAAGVWQSFGNANLTQEFWMHYNHSKQQHMPSMGLGSCAASSDSSMHLQLLSLHLPAFRRTSRCQNSESTDLQKTSCPSWQLSSLPGPQCICLTSLQLPLVSGQTWAAPSDIQSLVSEIY